MNVANFNNTNSGDNNNTTNKKKSLRMSGNSDRGGSSSSAGGFQSSNLTPSQYHHIPAGFCVSKGGENYSNRNQQEEATWPGLSMNFTTNINITGTPNMISSTNPIERSTLSTNTAGFSIGPWEEEDYNQNSFVFSTPSNKSGCDRNFDPNLLNTLSALDPQIDLSGMGLEIGALSIPEDSTPCKIRAKRGFATHPRSIAERERRTRISGKLKKLQELVPNMDKQTSYSEMLDLAVEHIKGLQMQIQKLNKVRENCTCGCKKN